MAKSKRVENWKIKVCNKVTNRMLRVIVEESGIGYDKGESLGTRL